MREKRTRGQEKTEPLFDYKLDSFDLSSPLVINYDGVADSVVSTLAAAAEDEAAEASAQIKLIEAPQAPYKPPKPISKLDPLSPDIFMGHHRRMEREERRMQVQERQQLIVMASRIRAQKESLARPDWSSAIEKIVRIYDPSDSTELNRKRDLALAEMETFLTKFEEYNKRYNRRESRNATPLPSAEDAKIKKIQKSRKAASTSSKSSKSKQQAKPSAAPKRSAPAKPEPEELFISIRPIALGYMVPPKLFPPREFALPPLLVSEVESYDLVERLKKQRLKK